MGANNSTSVYNDVDLSQYATKQELENAAAAWSAGYTPKGPASVSTINGLTGQQNGDVYTLIDGGTVNPGALTVYAGNQIAWDAANSVWYQFSEYATKQQVGVNEIKTGTTSSSNFNLLTYNGSIGEVINVYFETSAPVNLTYKVPGGSAQALVNNKTSGFVQYTLTDVSVTFGFFLYTAASTTYKLRVVSGMNKEIDEIDKFSKHLSEQLGDITSVRGSTSSSNFNLVTYNGKVGDVIEVYFNTSAAVNLTYKVPGGSAQILVSHKNSGFVQYTLTDVSVTFGIFLYTATSTQYEINVFGNIYGIASDLVKLKLACGVPSRKINFMSFGDSISSEAYYMPYLRSLLNVDNHYNFAVAGATVADRVNTNSYNGNPTMEDGPSNVLGNQLQKLLNGIENNYTMIPDVILISAITNDSNPTLEEISFDSIEENFTEGTTAIEITSPTFDASDTYAPHRKNVAGSLRYIVGTLEKLYPNAIIFIATPIQASTDSSNKNFPNIMELKQQYIKNIAKRLSIISLHVGEECGILSDFEYNGGFWSSSYATEELPKQGRDLRDGLHPNGNGAMKMAKYMAQEILNKLRGYL